MDGIKIGGIIMKIITVSTQKGGVGKTTTAINIAAALAEMNKKVLLVDLDPQGNATTGSGIDNMNIKTISDAMKADIEGTFTLKDLYISSNGEYDVLASNIELANVELSLGNVYARESVLKRVLEPVKRKYDYIVIDTLPSLGILTANAFTVADFVLVPILAKDIYSLQGFDALVHSINVVRRCINPNLEILGEIITMYDGRNKNDKIISQMVKDDERTNVFNSVIPSSTKVAEANRNGQSVIKYEPNGKAAEAYRRLTEEILERMK